MFIIFHGALGGEIACNFLGILCKPLFAIKKKLNWQYATLYYCYESGVIINVITHKSNVRCSLCKLFPLLSAWHNLLLSLGTYHACLFLFTSTIIPEWSYHNTLYFMAWRNIPCLSEKPSQQFYVSQFFFF